MFVYELSGSGLENHLKFRLGGYISLNNNVLGLISLNLISTIKRCPMLPSRDILSKIVLSSVRLGGCSCFLIQLYDKGLVMDWPYWLFGSI